MLFSLCVCDFHVLFFVLFCFLLNGNGYVRMRLTDEFNAGNNTPREYYHSNVDENGEDYSVDNCE